MTWMVVTAAAICVFVFVVKGRAAQGFGHVSEGLRALRRVSRNTVYVCSTVQTRPLVCPENSLTATLMTLHPQTADGRAQVLTCSGIQGSAPCNRSCLLTTSAARAT